MWVDRWLCSLRSLWEPGLEAPAGASKIPDGDGNMTDLAVVPKAPAHVDQGMPHGQAWGVQASLMPSKDLHPRILSPDQCSLICEGKRQMSERESFLSPYSPLMQGKDSREDWNAKVSKKALSPQNEETWKGKDTVASSRPWYVDTLNQNE